MPIIDSKQCGFDWLRYQIVNPYNPNWVKPGETVSRARHGSIIYQNPSEPLCDLSIRDAYYLFKDANYISSI